MARMSVLGRFKRPEIFSDDSNYFWTATFLLVPAIAFLVVRVMYVQSAVTCFVPTNFVDQQVNYIHEACWNQDTFRNIPVKNADSDPIFSSTKVTSPHAWIPFYLIFSFLALTLPQGLNHVVRRCFRTTSAVGDGGKSLAAETAQTLHEATTRRIQTNVLLLVKFLIFLNLLLQLVWINVHFRDVTVTEKNGANKSSTVDVTYPAFPQHLLCDVDLTLRNTIQSYTMECFFPINGIYNIYKIILSAWLALVAAVTLVGFINNLAFAFIPPYTRSVLSRYLQRGDVLAIQKTIQGTDGLLRLGKLCKTSDQGLVRDVGQLLREFIKSTGTSIGDMEDGGGNSTRSTKESRGEEMELNDKDKSDVKV